MSSLHLLRLVSRTQPRCLLQSQLIPQRRPTIGRAPVLGYISGFSTSVKRQSGSHSHDEETFEEFTVRYEKEFDNVHDVFELQRNLNNAFAYDLVPSPVVITAALKAARRVNDFPTAVRIFEGISQKVENKGQYDEYLRDLKSVRDELGISLKEEIYPDWDNMRQYLRGED